MTQSVRIEEDCDFQQIALPIDFGSGEHVLQRIRREAGSKTGTWYELYLVVTSSGFLIEKHSGSSQQHGRLKETWFRRFLPDAKRIYSRILRCILNQKFLSPKKNRGLNNEEKKQQKLFD